MASQCLVKVDAKGINMVKDFGYFIVGQVHGLMRYIIDIERLNITNNPDLSDTSIYVFALF